MQCVCKRTRFGGQQHPHHHVATTREGSQRAQRRLQKYSADPHTHCGSTESLLPGSKFEGTSRRQASPPLVHHSSRRKRDVARGHPHGVALNSLHGSLVPPARGPQLDLTRPPKGGCLRNTRYWSPAHGHPLRGRMGDHLQCPRGEVHRLHDAAALPGCAIVLRIPPKGQPPLRLLSTLPSSSAPIMCPLVLAN